jgi:hypothetical protein
MEMEGVPEEKPPPSAPATPEVVLVGLNEEQITTIIR